MKHIKPFNILLEARLNTEKFKHVKFLGGSTGADLYKDTSTDELWVIKRGAHINHMYNEYLSNKLYTKWGVNVPETYIGEIKGEEVLITKYLKDSVPLGEVNSLDIKNKVAKGFVFDVILSNWDVVGTNTNLDNIRVTPDGEVWRVDNGGALMYRAMGAKKGNAFSTTPNEQETLKNPDITLASKFFKHLNNYDIKNSLEEESKRYIIDKKVSHIKFLKDIREIIGDKDNNMPRKDKDLIYKTLAKRVFNLYKMFNV